MLSSKLRREQFSIRMSDEQKKSTPSPLVSKVKDRYPSTCIFLHSLADELNPLAPSHVILLPM